MEGQVPHPTLPIWRGDNKHGGSIKSREVHILNVLKYASHNTREYFTIGRRNHRRNTILDFPSQWRGVVVLQLYQVEKIQ